MPIKLPFILCFTLMTLLYAESDSLDTGAQSAGYLRGVRARISEKLKQEKFEQEQIEKKKQDEEDKVSKDNQTIFGNNFEKSIFSIGYRYNMDKNLDFAGHGLSFRRLGENVGIETYITYQEFDDLDSTKRVYPAEKDLQYYSKDNRNKIVFTLPDYKKTVIGVNLLFVLNRSNNSMLHLLAGLGINNQTSKEYFRQYSSYGYKYTGSEETKTITSSYGFVNLGLGATYNLSENIIITGEVKLKGELGSKANYSPLTNITLYYQF